MSKVSEGIPEVEDPFALLLTWKAAAERGESHDSTAACLATSTSEGAPSARMVLVKAIDSRGLVFYTNEESRKGRELAANPQVALTFYWPKLVRQVRVEGAAEGIEGEEADRYFASRPRGSQIGAWASAQSSVLTDGLDELTRRFEAETERFAGRPVPRPPHWVGYRVIPNSIEFWQHRDDRMHERLVYQRDNGTWTCARLAP